MKVSITPDTASLELSWTELKGLIVMAEYAKTIGSYDSKLVDNANMLIEELSKVETAMKALH